MKNSILTLLFLSISVAQAIDLSQPQDHVRTRKLTPGYLKDLLDKHKVDQLFTVIDDDGVKDPDEDTVEEGVTLLHLISRTPTINGQGRQVIYELARRVVGEQPNLVNAQQSGGFTPLHNAAYRGNTQLVDLFLSSGADPKIKDYRYKRTAEEWARQAGKRQTVKALKRPATANPRRLPGMPPPYIGTW